MDSLVDLVIQLLDVYFRWPNHSFIQHLSQHTLQHLFDNIFLFYMRHRTVIPCLHFISEFAKRNGFYFRTSHVYILAHINTTRTVYYSFAKTATFMHSHCILSHTFILILLINGSSHWKWKSNAYLMPKPYRYDTQNWDENNAHLDMKIHCQLSCPDSRIWANE